MATSEELIRAQKVTVGLFNAALGQDNLAEVESIIDGGASVEELADILAAHPLFVTGVMGLATTPATQAAILLQNFGLSSGSEDAASADAIAEGYFVSQIEAGVGFGALIIEAVDYLDGNIPATFTETANLLANKALVGATYSASQSSTDLSELQGVLAGLSGDSLLTQEEADAIVAGGGVGGETFNLTTGADNFNLASGDATNGNDTYVARGNSSLDNADFIDGAGGEDVLEVLLDNSETAETPVLENIEIIKIQAQATTVSSGDNNVDQIANGTVTIGLDENGNPDVYESNIDAGDFGSVDGAGGVREFWSEDSRADLVVEDVSRDSHTTFIGVKETDPGDVDYSVFFDPENITAGGADNTGAFITLDILDQINAPAEPLKQHSFVSFTFVLNEETHEVTGLQAAETYEELRELIDLQLTGDPLDSNNNGLGLDVTVARIENGFTDQNGLAGDRITITANDGSDITNGVLETGPSKIPNEIDDTFGRLTDTVGVEIPALTSVEVILDRVGKGSQSGDLLFGSDSLGDFSGSKGIQQFNVDVDRSSWISTLDSTNNTLEVINVENIGANGNLKITAAPPGGVNQNNGIQDVRVFDASTMTGYVELDADLSAAVTGKYLDLTDTATDSSADNSAAQQLLNVVDREFSYDFGSGDDMLNLTISESNLETAGTTNREDFVLEIQGNDGDDSITTTIVDDTSVDDTTNWYLNSKENANLTVDGGAGNDMIHTNGAGDFIINAGSGDDTVYADNSGNAVARATVNEVQTITFGDAGDLANQSEVTVTLSDGQTSTTTTINNGDSATAVRDAVLLSMADSTETATVVFAAAAAGETVILGGLTWTDDGTGATAIEVAEDFDSLANGAAPGAVTSGTFTGTLTGWSTADNGGTDTVVFTSSTANANVTDLVEGGGTAGVTSVTTAQGSGLTNVTATATGVDGIVLTYGAAYAPAGSEDIANATVTGIATDSAVTVVTTTGGVDGTDAVDAITEVGVLQLATVAAATTDVDFENGDGVGGTVTITATDTDGNGTISLVELTNQVVAGASTLTGWTLGESNASLGLLSFTANTAGLIAPLTTAASASITSFTSAGAPIVVEDVLNPIVVADGVDAVAFVAGTAEVQTITVDNGADQAGAVTMQIDTDADGVFQTDETFTFNITAGDEGSVAAQLASQITALSGVSAAQGAAGATIDDVIITWAVQTATSNGGSATQDALATTFVDGAVKSATVVETVKGLEATSTPAATWVVNSNNTIISDLDSSGVGVTGLLFKAALTVTYSGANTRGESGVIMGAAAAFDNGFESTVTIGTESNVGNQTHINQAIKAAIIGDASEGGLQGSGDVLEELLSVNDGPANTIAIHSLIDGEFREDDLDITITAATFTDLTASEQNSLRATLQDINNDSTAVYSDADMQAALDAAAATANANNSVQMATTDGTTLIAGSASTTVSDNTIALETGNDVVVLGTDDQSNDTLVYTGFGNGVDVVVNFTETGTAADAIDFSAYLDAQTSASGSSPSAIDIAITLNGDLEAGANEVTIINNFADYESAGLTNITTGYTVQDVTDLVGETYNTIFMVENGDNDGEYKIFNVEASQGTDADFTTATLIGQVDFGNSLTAVTSSNFDDTIGA